MTETARRIFVGCERLPIAALADALAGLLSAFSAASSPLAEGSFSAASSPFSAASSPLVALPGSRAGRVLGLRLARHFGPRFVPPRIVTLGVLVDELVTLPGPVAPRLVRTLAWQQALRALGDELRAITPRIPKADDLRAWSQLGATIRALHGELGAECRDFASVQQDPEVARRPGELSRWRALERAHGHFRGLLAREGLLDPHDARREALAAGRIDRTRPVILAGCVELSGLQRAVLEPLRDRVTALVPAPSSMADAFDALGALDVDYWSECPLSIDTRRWRVVGEPADQADAVVAWLAELGASRAPTEITVGLIDDEVRPALERRLARHGLKARSAAGPPLAQCAAARVVAVVGAYLGSRTFAAFADLVRLPEIEAFLAETCALGGRAPAALLDRYHEAHLPGRAEGKPAEGALPTSDPSSAVRRIHRALEKLLSPLDPTSPQPLARSTEAIRALLSQLFASADLEALGRSGRRLSEELAAVGACLAELERVPAALALGVSARDVAALFADEIAAVTLPPEPGDERTIEILGWLELALDDAPALAITGLAEGRVPASPLGDAFLPDRVRTRLGLVDDRRRVARDACLLHLILASRPETLLVSARRDAARNPLAPSRLLLRASASDVALRVRHAFASPPRPRPTGRVAPPPHTPPRVDVETPKSIAVTAFKTYLESPYRYYVEQVLRLRSADDDAHELDANAFGTLLHAVLARLGGSALVASADAGAIERYLHAALEEIARERFGSDVLPAVTLQLLQARRRLSLFSGVQARRAASGWRIHATEWQPSQAIEFDVDGTPIVLTGHIDRIDRHSDGRFAILDYKTGNSLPRWKSAYDRDTRVWRDLQLPLYRLLAAELDAGIPTGENVVFGWLCLGKDSTNTNLVDHESSAADEPWRAEALLAADECARDVVRRIRRHEFDELGNFQPDDPARSALAGFGLVGMEEDPDPLAIALGDAVPVPVLGAPVEWSDVEGDNA